MRISLDQLINPELKQYISESRKINSVKAAARPKGQPELSDPEVLEKIRTERNKTIESPERDVAIQNVGSGNHKVPVRIITPKHGKVNGVFYEIHGGGFYLDCAARSDKSNEKLADALGFAVVSVEYRMAPEDPWPAAPDDCAAAAGWLVAHAESEFGASKLFIGGASAGANLVMTTLLRLQNSGLHDLFSGVVLQYGAYDLSGKSPGGRLYEDEYFIEAYAGHVDDRTIPDISPLYADLISLPPVLMQVGNLDVLFEDNLAMFARLIAANNDVDLRVYPESEHGFISRPSKMSEAATSDLYGWLKTRSQKSGVK